MEEKLHGIQDGTSNSCPYKDTLMPMAWLMKRKPVLSDPWVNSKHRQGTPLNFAPCPFEKFIMLTPTAGLPHILGIFYFYIEMRGPLEMPLTIYAPPSVF